MTPYEQAYQLYQAHPQALTFPEYLGWHLQFGFVYSTPSFFVMGRAMDRFDLEGDSAPLKLSDKPDTWFVHLLCGDMSKAWSILPYELPYMAFERYRDGSLYLTVMPLQRIREKTEVTKT